MNIQQAKEHISNAITAYRTRDQYGKPMIPRHRQRPIFLVGAPGIGKTAIMEQIAAEMCIPLVSYSMTHHTRQSALGLPFIVNETFNGREYRVSEYTMSEIIAEVYRTMRTTGVQEGILFLDEINCVSETLAPAMLQFLQYKVFGQHKVPEGWIIVTAGNPPEYNDSVREFDMATMDRVKRIDVKPNYDVWRSYAFNTDVHPAVLSYLDIYKDDFEKVRKSVDGMRFVTPRSWVDLSDMLRLYELHKLDVDVDLIGQYLQDTKVARNFASYYDLFVKYRSDYQVDSILAGKVTQDIIDRAAAARFDERFAVISLLLTAVNNPIRQMLIDHAVLGERQKTLIQVRRTHMTSSKKSLGALLSEVIENERSTLNKALAGSMISRNDEMVKRGLIASLEASQNVGAEEDSFDKAFLAQRDDYNSRLKQHKKDVEKTKKMLDNAFAFIEKAFGDSREMLIFVTELTRSETTAKFIAGYGSDAYFRHNKELLFYERQIELIDELKSLDDRTDDPDGE